ncbi:SHOCT domain-containing protein [Salininema proteolyticum]|uniref:SHOCT domain-containing protein n=1 Tax=Salininema proteolyticum TaxID=1607685 RepID=A0ABV8U4T8_9ACTN
MMDGMGMGGGFAMMLGMVVFWGLVIWGIVALVRTSPQSRRVTGGRDAEKLLADRYARGEMDENEYLERLGILRGTRG